MELVERLWFTICGILVLIFIIDSICLILLMSKDESDDHEIREEKESESIGGKSQCKVVEAWDKIIEISTMRMKCKKMLKKLMKHKHGWVFNKPINVKELILDDYYDIIKHPMDLGTVKLKFKRNEYKTPQDFADDVRLTFNNVMTYNQKGDVIYVMAQQLLGEFEKMFKQAYKKYELEAESDQELPVAKELVEKKNSGIDDLDESAKKLKAVRDELLRVKALWEEKHK